MTYVHFLVKQGCTNRKAVRLQVVVLYEIKTISVISKSNLALHMYFLKKKTEYYIMIRGLMQFFYILIIEESSDQNIM
jgi:hypothetical protein